MESNVKVTSNVKQNKALLERIDKLEFILLLIVNQLRTVPNFPKEVLDTIEKIITNR